VIILEIGEREAGLDGLMRLTEDDLKKGMMRWIEADKEQYGGSPVKVGDEEYSLFRDHEYV
jgi:hypothetical protein